MGVQRVDQWVMLWAIPAIAITVAARQVYLSSTDDLSTWKGGGMGMFAGSENNTRYAKIYMTFADGRRQPLLRITETQEKLKGQVVNYPNERNLRTLAKSIKATKWWASTTRIPLNVFGEDGQKVRDGTEQLYDLYPAQARSATEPADWRVEIEYWKATYDPSDKRIRRDFGAHFQIRGRRSMTNVAETFAPSAPAPFAERFTQVLEDIRRADSVTYLTLFLAVAFGFTTWFYQLSAMLALLAVLLVPSAAKRPALWGLLATMASITLVQERDLADNHKYLLCYWLWVMCIAHVPNGQELRDRISSLNARFFLVFIFLGAALQKFVSSSYMSGAMFELELLLDGRFAAFAHLVGIDPGLGEESLRRLILLENPYVHVLNHKIKLLSTDHVHFVAQLITLYDLYVQVAIGALLLFRRATTDLIAHLLLLFFIFTTYIPAPVLGFGFTLSILGFALVKERSQYLSAAYLLSMVAVIFYQVPWREWVLAT